MDLKEPPVASLAGMEFPFSSSTSLLCSSGDFLGLSLASRLQWRILSISSLESQASLLSPRFVSTTGIRGFLPSYEDALRLGDCIGPPGQRFALGVCSLLTL